MALAQAQAEVSEKVTQALGPDAFDGDAHALLVSIYRDTTQPIELRVTPARSALPYEKPRLAAVQLEQSPGETTIRIIGGLPTAAEFETIARRVASEI